MMHYRLGIDVGGTNTDAVLIDEQLNVVADIKMPTSEDIYSGILQALRKILEISEVDRTLITKAMLGTTQCTNAIVERKHLAKIGILRIGAPASMAISPMVDWAESLRKVAVATEIVGGGYEYDGKQIAPFDEAAARSFFERMAGKVDAIAISCVFASVRDDQEKEAAALCRAVMGEQVHVSISSEIGSMGLIERENATILNAALHSVAKSFTEGFASSLREEGLVNAKLYLSQNDGTLMTVEQARRYPILTIACGPTNSIRGADYLCSLSESIVIDVGGTTTDIGVIKNGFPRESGVAVTIGGVRTNFRMPDVISIGLGGGSIVRQQADGTVTVGPDSVGYEITEKALVFGGDVVTATDLAVAAGMADIGDASLVAGLDKTLVKNGLDTIKGMVEDCLDAMKLSSEPVAVVLVGGGSVIVPESLEGALSVARPAHFGTANAIGSAISKVSGNYEKLVSFEKISRDEALAKAKEEAMQMAVSSGAKPDTVEIIDVEEVPLAYYPGNTSRVRIKAAGDLA
jgi:N-methylhydantoinase A/oxoprolinase/acetone carboxylase beta subunit